MRSATLLTAIGLIRLLVAPAGVQAAHVFVSFQLENQPAAVARVAILPASDLTKPMAAAVPFSKFGTIDVPFDVAHDVVVRFELETGEYLLDGPFRWPADRAVRYVSSIARRTVRGTLPDASSPDPPRWIDAEGGATEQWPRCSISGQAWTCIGVPVGKGGVIAILGRSVFAAALSGRERANGDLVLDQAAWALLLLLASEDGHEIQSAHVRALRARSTSQTSPGGRMDLAPANGCRVTEVVAAAFLLMCRGADDVIVQVEAEDHGALRIPITASAQTLLSPLTMHLARSVSVHGSVQSVRGMPAVGARLDLSELIEMPARPGKTRIIRRSLMEAVVRADGSFEFAGLAAGAYELLAVHERYGRAKVLVNPGPTPVTIRLVPTARVEGRVLQNGIPLAAASVEIPPDHMAYLQGGDPFDVVAPATVTASDGRFELALPARGGSEVLIRSDDRSARYALPAIAAGGLLSLGDLNLPTSIVVAVVYTGDERCVLRAAGPFGRSGVHVIEAEVLAPARRRLLLPEPGQWVLRADCGGQEARVQPAVMDVPRTSAWSAHISLLGQ